MKSSTFEPPPYVLITRDSKLVVRMDHIFLCFFDYQLFSNRGGHYPNPELNFRGREKIKLTFYSLMLTIKSSGTNRDSNAWYSNIKLQRML